LLSVIRAALDNSFPIIGGTRSSSNVYIYEDKIVSKHCYVIKNLRSDNSIDIIDQRDVSEKIINIPLEIFSKYFSGLFYGEIK